MKKEYKRSAKPVDEEKIMKSAGFIMLCCSLVLSNYAQEVEWTWAHRKIFSANEQDSHKNKPKIMYAKSDIPLFNQLLFSWNAKRPEQGYFSFHVQVHDVTTKKWTQWYKMMAWGHQVQHSYASEERDSIVWSHVRMELGKHFADGFRIRIQSHDGADLSLIHSFVVSVSDLTQFSSEEEVMYRMPSIIIKNVPLISQFGLDHPRNNGLCSPTSVTMLCSYLLGQNLDSLAIAEKSFDYGLDAYGSWPFNTAHAYEVCQGKYWFSVVRLHSFKQLYARLLQGIPVVVSVRGPLVGSATPYASGHLLLVIGWDDATKEVICHDPAFGEIDAVLMRYPLKDFIVAWERSRRLAYAADKVLDK